MIIDEISKEENWNDFLQYKLDVQHLSKADEKLYQDFISAKRFIPLAFQWQDNIFPTSLPEKHIINKISSQKKRVVYSYEKDENIMLKYIAWNLYRYDSCFSDNCYAFRRNYGVKDAIGKIRRTKNIDNMFCLKADIHNYFNSIDTTLLVDKLDFLKKDDIFLYNLLKRMLLNNSVLFNGNIISENHGAMAGTPTSPFLANIYLNDIDKYFAEKNILYYRYSDDILIFADNLDKLTEYKSVLYSFINKMRLTINPDKVAIYNPGEAIEFLGFSYHNGVIDLSASTMKKTKQKLKRKADALRRWAREKNLPMDKAAIGFIKSINYKFYGDDDDFTWSRWFFPNITTDKSLKELDKYTQEYIRYICTGRHYKGNFRISYSQLKHWGYRCLVNEYYSTYNIPMPISPGPV